MPVLHQGVNKGKLRMVERGREPSHRFGAKALPNVTARN
jgi:hypothetical protein